MDYRFIRLLLLPFSLVYLLITLVRNWLYDYGFLRGFDAGIPVICVGNVLVGGTGKSPVVQMVVRELIARGKKPVILSRGYGGSEIGPCEVSSDTPATFVGDEPLMHFNFFNKNVPVVISRKRVDGAKLIINKKLGDVIVLDDGFQHRALKRDIDLLLTSANKNLLDCLLLPAGNLRESFFLAKKRSSAILLVDRDRGNQGAKIGITVNIKPISFIDAYSGEVFNLDYFRNKQVVALSGIAHPEQFFSMLEKLNISIIKKYSFPDHYLFLQHDWQKALDFNLPVVFTDKDFAKIKTFISSENRGFILRIEAKIAQGNDIFNKILDSI